MPKHPEHILMVEEMTPSDPSDAQDVTMICPWVDPHKLKKIDGVWYKEGQRVVTKGSNDKQKSAESHHDPPVYGHPGINKTIKLVKWGYWWLTLRQQDVTTYVQGCAECQWHKVNNSPIQAALEPIFPKLEAMPFETIALNFITNSQFPRDTIPSLPSQIMTVPWPLSLSLVSKKSVWKKQQCCISNMYLCASDSPPKL
jgi:hypothetical protein